MLIMSYTGKKGNAVTCVMLAYIQTVVIVSTVVISLSLKVEIP